MWEQPRPSSWEELSLSKLLDILRPYDADEVERLEKRLQRFPDRAEMVRRRVIIKCRKLKLDPSDVFHPHPSRKSLGTRGLDLGNVSPLGQDFFFLDKDWSAGGIMFSGCTSSGKTTALCHVLEEGNRNGIGAIVIDLRGDLVKILAPRIPDLLVIGPGQDRLNPCSPPPGVKLRDWLRVISGRLTFDLGLKEASQIFLINVFAKLAKACEKLRVVPTMRDVLEFVKEQKTRPRSSDEACKERIIARLGALIDICGPVFSVQKGFPVVEKAEQGRVVVIHHLLEKMACDFVAAIRLYYTFTKRLFSPDPFRQPRLFYVLDEQRSLIRAQRHDEFVPDIELAFSRSRALGISYLVAEQLISQVSPAVITSCRLKLAFCNTAPELRYVANSLGLDFLQQNEIPRLPPGECIARLAGNRIPYPFRLKFPWNG